MESYRVEVGACGFRMKGLILRKWVLLETERASGAKEEPSISSVLQIRIRKLKEAIKSRIVASLAAIICIVYASRDTPAKMVC